MSGRPDPSPWLDHLRTDRRGLPVPYINAWGAESPERTRVAYDRLVGGPALFQDDHGEVPDFTRQNPQRQRQCVVEGLCQVCGRPVPWSRRFLVVADLSVRWVRVGLAGVVPVVIEPWLCGRCCEIAVRWCPALIRRERDEHMVVVPVRSQRETVLTVSTGRVDGFEQAGDQVRIWAKVQLSRWDARRAVQVPG